MKGEAMKIGIIGAGAMGQMFGGKFIAAGEDVVLFDVSDPAIQSINTNGITVLAKNGPRHVDATAATTSDFNEPIDFVMFFTKAFHTAGAIEGGEAPVPRRHRRPHPAERPGAPGSRCWTPSAPSGRLSG